MINLNKALTIISNNTKPLNSEVINATDSIDRVLCAGIKAKNSNPSYDSSAMDGVAIKFSTLLKNKHKLYKTVGEVFAGDRKKYNIKDKEAVRIYTGGKMPLGTDTVIIQENIENLKNNYIKIKGKVTKNQFVRKKGKDYKTGALLLKKNKKISPTDIALIVSAGIKKIKVFKKANVVLFSSGDELIKPDRFIKEGEVYASSMYMLKELILKSGCKIKTYKILKDKNSVIFKNFKQINNVDLIITTGGVSVGKKDLIKPVINKLDFDLKFWKVSVMPGKPILFGFLKKVPFFGLPGNPVSSYVCFMIFVLKAINKMNKLEKIKLVKKHVILKHDFYHSSERTAFLRGKLLKNKEGDLLEVLKDQDSSLLKNLSDSNCLVKITPSSKIFKRNTKLEVLYIKNI